MNMAAPLPTGFVFPIGTSSIIEVDLNSHPIPWQIARDRQIGDPPSRGNLGFGDDADCVDLTSPFSQDWTVFGMSLGPLELPATDKFERQSDLALGCCHRQTVAVSGPPSPNPGVILLSSNPDIKAVRRV